MSIHLPTQLRPEIGASAAAAEGVDFTVLAVGSERELGLHVKHLLEEARLSEARLLIVPTLQIALAKLATERPGIIFLAVGPPELANLSALVRLQAAAPGVPVVPLPTLAHDAGPQSGWWPLRARRAVNRAEVVSLLHHIVSLEDWRLIGTFRRTTVVETDGGRPGMGMSIVDITAQDGAIVEPQWLAHAESVHRELRPQLPPDYAAKMARDAATDGDDVAMVIRKALQSALR